MRTFTFTFTSTYSYIKIFSLAMLIPDFNVSEYYQSLMVLIQCTFFFKQNTNGYWSALHQVTLTPQLILRIIWLLWYFYVGFTFWEDVVKWKVQ